VYDPVAQLLCGTARGLVAGAGQCASGRLPANLTRMACPSRYSATVALASCVKACEAVLAWA
jgi:hypothetical protein